MQNDQNRLKIHTNIRPAPEGEIKEPGQEHSGAEEAVQMTEQIQTHEAAEQREQMKSRGKRTGRAAVRLRRGMRTENNVEDRLTTGERLVRNTAVACALLLSVMALKNVDQPWSTKVTEGVRQAMTMRVDWDDTLGRLSFVRSLVPDTALVFFNMGGSVQLNRPVEGQITHEYTDQQPWIEYACARSQPVCSVAAGRVTAAGQGAGDDWIVLIEDKEGGQAVYGYLADICVMAGQEVEAGQQIGTTADVPEARLYLELREEGIPIDPAERMR